MNLNDIRNVLKETFNKNLSEGRKRHIVFWFDEAKEFLEDIDELALENVRILKLTENNSFTIKYEIEKADTNSHFLIYSNIQKPSPRQNWLLDIMKYSIEFSSDKVTVIMRELGVKDDALKGIFRKYLKFFNNKERLGTFAGYGICDFSEEKVDIAVLSVLCKVDINSLESVLKALFSEMLNEKNRHMEAIEKFGDINALWKLVERHYGFTMEDKNLEKLLVFLMITNLCYTLEEPIPSTWKKYVSSKKADCFVFLNHFMNHSTGTKVYDKLANNIENKLNIVELIKQWDIDNYLKCDTFKIFDMVIINKLTELLVNSIEDYDRYKGIITERRKLHWFRYYKMQYEAINAAMKLFRAKKELDGFIRQHNCCEFIDMYTKEYYVIDMAYRKFYAAFDRLEDKESLMALREKVENIYVNWYLAELSIKWSSSMENELKEHWSIQGLNQQKDFYELYIKPFVSKGERVIVIVSDALRYEASKEFSDTLNVERKAFTQLEYMQGVIPSYTKLGMASILPHKTIELDERLEVIVDHINSSGTENRQNILSKYSGESMAIQYKALKEMTRNEFRKTFTGKKLIYIYHNSIDARGDHAATEREVFSAVDETFKELKALINELTNNVSASNIFITSDHGFIYKQGTLTESDKTKKDIEDAASLHRRFIISNRKEAIEGTICFPMDYILGEKSGKYVIVPRGTNRFKIQGQGANYVHGGAMLQEIVIPVIKFKNDRSKNSRNDIKKVEVKLTNMSRKITNTITYLEFFQTEKVEAKKVPLRIKAYFTDEEGNRISTENIIIADSKSLNPEERTYKEKFVLKNMSYDKTKKYYLILEDEDASAENVYEEIPFTIDIVPAS
jgi:uncharacterized protein (TIGR02687 family)